MAEEACDVREQIKIRLRKWHHVLLMEPDFRWGDYLTGKQHSLSTTISHPEHLNFIPATDPARDVAMGAGAEEHKEGSTAKRKAGAASEPQAAPGATGASPSGDAAKKTKQ